jgi:aminoglycoside phosphotransferase
MDTTDVSTRVWLRNYVDEDFKIKKHHFSNQDDVYAIEATEGSFYLKTAKDLKSERDNLQRTLSYIRVPKVIGFGTVGDKDHLLMTALPGKNLAEYVDEWDTMTIVREFARAVKEFHALDITKLFTTSAAPGTVVLHGDMAMLNIICTEPGSAGFIDLGQMSVGAADLDLADALWSLQRNLGAGYGELFLSEYGNFVMTEKVDKALKYRHQA